MFAFARAVCAFARVVMTTINMMVSSHVSARQVPRGLRAAWMPLLGKEKLDAIRIPGRLACNKFRQMIPWLVRAQIGMDLTRAGEYTYAREVLGLEYKI